MSLDTTPGNLDYNWLGQSIGNCINNHSAKSLACFHNSCVLKCSSTVPLRCTQVLFAFSSLAVAKNAQRFSASKVIWNLHEGTINTIEMGARQYVPILGRFLEVDPVEGGSANDYDYCNGDSLGCFDLNGLHACDNRRNPMSRTKMCQVEQSIENWSRGFAARVCNYGKENGCVNAVRHAAFSSLMYWTFGTNFTNTILGSHEVFAARNWSTKACNRDRLADQHNNWVGSQISRSMSRRPTLGDFEGAVIRRLRNGGLDLGGGLGTDGRAC